MPNVVQLKIDDVTYNIKDKNARERLDTLENGYIRHDEVQTLQDSEKETARGNVDAASVGSVDDLKSALNDTDSALKNVDFVFRNSDFQNVGVLREVGSINPITTAHNSGMILLPEIAEKIYVSKAIQEVSGMANIGFYLNDIFGNAWLLSAFNATAGTVIDIPYNANYVVFSSSDKNEFCAAFVIENLRVFDNVEYLIKDKRLTQAYPINIGRVKNGIVGNVSEVDSANTAIMYFDIPLSGAESQLYSTHEFSPTIINYAFIHVLDSNDTILALILAANLGTNTAMYYYDSSKGLYIIDVDYIRAHYTNATTLRVCMPIKQMTDFCVKKIADAELLEREISALEKSTERAIYYAQDADKKANTNNLQETLVKLGKETMCGLNKTNRCLNFTFITDTHVYPYESNIWSCSNGLDLFVKAAKYTDFAIHCGDITESGAMSVVNPDATPTVSKEDNIANLEIAMQKLSVIKEPLFIVHGNHDVNSYHRNNTNGNVDLTTIVYNKEWNALTQNMENGSIHDAANPFMNYYYYDFDIFKTRVIVLNEYIDENTGDDKAYGNAAAGYGQLKWFAETALDFMDKPSDERSGWSALLFTHGGYTTLISGIIKAFMAGGVVSHSSDYGYYKDYREQGALPFIGLIHGDNHVDVYDNSKGFNNIGVDQSFVKLWQHVSEDSIGDANEYCVDYFSIDFANNIIHETRMGRGDSRRFHYGVNDTDNYQIVT